LWGVAAEDGGELGSEFVEFTVMMKWAVSRERSWVFVACDDLQVVGGLRSGMKLVLRGREEVRW
jgi:hypothetical protein